MDQDTARNPGFPAPPGALSDGVTDGVNMVTTEPRCKNIIIFGPPGVGKGAQADILRRRFSLQHLSTGEALREEIRNGTELGRAVREAVDNGRFADDETVMRIVASRIDSPEYAQGFVLDGFPRNLKQAEMLDRALTERGKSIDRVLQIAAPQEVILERLTGRRVCASCGATYHVKFKKPAVDAVCDICGGPVIRRPDDDPAIQLERLRTYEEQTRPLVEHYAARGLLVRIDGNQTIEDVAGDIAAALRCD